MEARHARPSAIIPDVTEPRHPADAEPDMDTAVENVDAVLGVAWARQFDRHNTPDGVRWVDTATGQVFADTIPALPSSDGIPT